MATTKKSKKKFVLPKTVYMRIDPYDGWLNAERNPMNPDANEEGDVWGEYELVRKVKVQSHIEEV